MTVGRICIREVHLADPGETIAEASRRMDRRDVGTLVVLDPERRPIGILTDRDIVLRVVARDLDPAATRVDAAMTRGVRSVSEETPIETALRMMRQTGCRRMPVVDGRGSLAGLVSLDDVLELLGEEMEEVRALSARGSSAQDT